MALKKLLPAAFAAATLFAAASAGAATLVTLNPSAANGGLGVIDAGTPAFQATGFTGVLDSTLVINGNAGFATYSETGSLLLSTFNDENLPGAGIVGGTNLGTNYDIFATFTLTGVGGWSGSQFTAAPGANLSFNLYADINGGGDLDQDILLGTGALDPTYPQVAFAIAFGSIANGSAGTAVTSLTATVQFEPSVGTEGVGGFFEAPSPFQIDIALGNIGGNTLNTTYSVDGGGVVTMVTNEGSGNATFIASVPEPSALALVGLALAGAGVASRRRKMADKV